MKKENKFQGISLFVIAFIYTTNKYLPYNIQIVAPSIVGIMLFGSIVYMKIKGNLSNLTAFICIIVGTCSILVSLSQYIEITTGNQDYGTLILIVALILMDILIIAIIINKYKNGTKKEFVKVRNQGLIPLIIFTIYLAVFVYSLVK